ncbi:hypothetical protein LXL04_037410 [Taraxacum kok-saghyz]
MEPTPNNNDDNLSSANQFTTSNLKGSDTHMFLVSNPLIGRENYMQWKYSIRIALGEKRKVGFNDGTMNKPETQGTELDDWISNDCMVRSWLLNAISKEISAAFIFSTTTREL